MYCLVCKFKSNILTAAFKVLPSVSLFTCALKWPLRCPWALLDPLWTAVSFFSSPPSSQLCIKWEENSSSLSPPQISISHSAISSFPALWRLLGLGWFVLSSFCSLPISDAWLCTSLWTLSFWRDVSCHTIFAFQAILSTWSPTPLTCSVNLLMGHYWQVLPCVINLAP